MRQAVFKEVRDLAAYDETYQQIKKSMENPRITLTLTKQLQQDYQDWLAIKESLQIEQSLPAFLYYYSNYIQDDAKFAKEILIQEQYVSNGILIANLVSVEGIYCLRIKNVDGKRVNLLKKTPNSVSFTNADEMKLIKASEHILMLVTEEKGLLPEDQPSTLEQMLNKEFDKYLLITPEGIKYGKWE